MGLLLAGCGGTSEQANRPLTVWAGGTGAKALAYQADEYTRQNPSVHFNIEQLDRQSLYDRLTKALEAGGVGLPDLVLLDTARLAGFAGTFPEGFRNLSELEGRYPAAFGAGQWEQVKFLGRVRALPWQTGPVGFFYRADLFERAGVRADELQTWDDLLAVSPKVQAASPGLKLLALDPTDFLQLVMAQQNTGFFTPDDKITLNGPAARRAATLLQKLNQAGLLLSTVGPADLTDAAGHDRIAGAITGLEWSATLTADLPAQKGLWRVLPLPALDKGGPRLTSLGGQVLAIPRTADQADRAAAFAAFCALDKTNALAAFQKFGLWPSYQPTYTDPAFAAPQLYFANQAVWQPFVARLNELPTLYYNADQSRAQEAARQAAADILGGRDLLAALDRATRLLKQQTNREEVKLK